MFEKDRPGAKDYPSARRPRLAGRFSPALVMILCTAGLVLIFVGELLTPRDVISSLMLIPLLAAARLLSPRPFSAIVALAAATIGIEVALRSVHPLTAAVELVVYLGLTLGVRSWLERTYDRAERGTPEIPPGIAEALTPRERDVVTLAVQGHTAPEIADALHIGERTVETHLANAYAKLGVRSKLELVRRAATLGI